MDSALATFLAGENARPVDPPADAPAGRPAVPRPALRDRHRGRGPPRAGARRVAHGPRLPSAAASPTPRTLPRADRLLALLGQPPLAAPGETVAPPPAIATATPATASAPRRAAADAAEPTVVAKAIQPAVENGARIRRPWIPSSSARRRTRASSMSPSSPSGRKSPTHRRTSRRKCRPRFRHRARRRQPLNRRRRSPRRRTCRPKRRSRRRMRPPPLASCPSPSRPSSSLHLAVRRHAHAGDPAAPPASCAPSSRSGSTAACSWCAGWCATAPRGSKGCCSTPGRRASGCSTR